VVSIDFVDQHNHLGEFVFHVGIPFFVLDEYADDIVPQDAKQDAKMLLSLTGKEHYCVNSRYISCVSGDGGSPHSSRKAALQAW
jgi:hypothetical protein